MERRFVLFGTGDWAPWADGVFTDLTVPGRYAAVVAAGQVENGSAAVEEYRAGAAARLDRVGIPSVQVPLLNRRDADRPEALECLDDAAFLYVLGGGPRETLASLRDSLFWRAFLDTRLPYVGSSGGAMLLGARCPTSPDDVRPGLALFPDVVIAAHWNELTEMWRARFFDIAGYDLLIGLDVNATLIGDGTDWQVRGPAAVHVRGSDGWRHYSDGAELTLPLLRST